MAWHDMAWHGMVWHGIALHCIVLHCILFHDLPLRSYLYHCIWSVITAHDLTPEKRMTTIIIVLYCTVFYFILFYFTSWPTFTLLSLPLCLECYNRP